MKKKLMMLCVAVMAAMGAWGVTNTPPVSAEGSEPKVTDVVAKQRYPWNGLVDITCNVSGIVGTTNELKLALAAVMPDTGNARSVRNFGSSCMTVGGFPLHKFAWPLFYGLLSRSSGPRNFD